MIPKPPLSIQYDLTLENGESQQFKIELDSETLLAVRKEERQPEWAKLDHCKCPNCPLEAKDSPYCPAATQVAGVVEGFARTWSFEQTEVRVHVGERVITKKTEAQAALGSLLGLYLATSGCPLLGKLRPLVRFHLPFASELETIFRASSMYLVAQFLRAASGLKPDWELKGLSEMYGEIAAVNRAFASRLRSAAPTDANLNGLILLDAFARALPESIEKELVELRPFLEAWAPSTGLEP